MADVDQISQSVLDGWVGGINYNRGVIMRLHPLGMRVCSYIDEPGVFRSSHGNEVDPELAREAGFDVDALLKERAKRKRLAEAADVIEREFNGVGNQEVIKEKFGFKVVHVGLGRHTVLDPDGNRLNPTRWLTKEEGLKLIGMVAREPEEKAA